MIDDKHQNYSIWAAKRPRGLNIGKTFSHLAGMPPNRPPALNPPPGNFPILTH